MGRFLRHSNGRGGGVESQRKVAARAPAQTEAMEEAPDLSTAALPMDESDQPTVAEAAAPPDDVARLTSDVRPLHYSWEQTDDEIKIYVFFDQCEELEGGVDEARVHVEYSEWNMLLLIQNPPGCS